MQMATMKIDNLDLFGFANMQAIEQQREKNELGLYSVQIIQGSKIIDKDQIRLRNIQTTEGMLNELKTIMELI